jgi:hypothetical protein
MMQTTYELNEGTRVVITDVDADGTPTLEIEMTGTDLCTTVLSIGMDFLDALAKHERKRAEVLWLTHDHGSMVQEVWWGDARGKRWAVDDMTPEHARRVYSFILDEAPRYYALAWACYVGKSWPRKIETFLTGASSLSLGDIKRNLRESPLCVALLERFEPSRTPSLIDKALAAHDARQEEQELRRQKMVARTRAVAGRAIFMCLGLTVEPQSLLLGVSTDRAYFFEDETGLLFEIVAKQHDAPRVYLRRNYGGSMVKPSGVSSGPGSQVQIFSMISLGETLHRWGREPFTWTKDEVDSLFPR